MSRELLPPHNLQLYHYILGVDFQHSTGESRRRKSEYKEQTMTTTKPIFSSHNLHQFMLRLDRISPTNELSTDFDLALATAWLQAHLDFIDGLDVEALMPQKQWLVCQATEGFRREAFRFLNCLLNLWVSGILSSSGKSRRETLDEIQGAYQEAVNFGRALLSLILPCSRGWYDATMGQKSESDTGPAATGGKRAGVRTVQGRPAQDGRVLSRQAD
jgi:hypothetical protein